jgi:uncharacterized protein (DUF983 family)
MDCGANSTGDEMERVISTLMASLDVECPKCENMFDAFDQDDGGNIMNPIFNNGWDKLIGCELTCPECGEEIELTGVEW